MLIKLREATQIIGICCISIRFYNSTTEAIRDMEIHSVSEGVYDTLSQDIIYVANFLKCFHFQKYPRVQMRLI